MRGSDVDEAMAQGRALVTLLRHADLTALTSVELTSALEDFERLRRMLETVDQTLIAEVVARGVAHEYAKTSPAALLVDLLRVRPGEARARITRAAELGPRYDLGGQPLGPILPTVAAAVAAGEISGAHADVIITATRNIPADLQAEFGQMVETTLTDYARHAHPDQLKKAAAVIADRLDSDGTAPKDEDQQRLRGYGLRVHADGTSTAYGTLTPDATAVWNTVFDSLAAPQPAADGTPDPRTADQRRHDAILDAGRRLTRSDLPHVGGAPVALLVMMQLQDFLAGTGTALTSHGPAAQRAPRRARRHQTAQGVLAGSSSRSVAGSGTTDRGTREGADCDARRPRQRDRTRPHQPRHSEAHHVIAWIDLGPTSIDNLTLLCGYHHRNFEALGWACHIKDGIPMWTPPAWIDRERRPRRNTANHLEIDFDTG